MFYSKKYNFIFIASPKTGTVTIHNLLKDIDPTGERNRINWSENLVITSDDIESGIIGHATAKEIKDVLGKERWDSINTIAFIRNPYSKLVSAYSFNKEQHLKVAFNTKGAKKKYFRMLRTMISFLLAKALPFSIWILFYPMKTNLSYCTNSKGKLLLKHIGRTENLERDFLHIAKKIGIAEDVTENLSFKQLNTSSHKAVSTYFESYLPKAIMKLKYSKEIKFYNEISKKIDKEQLVS